MTILLTELGNVKHEAHLSAIHVALNAAPLTHIRITL